MQICACSFTEEEEIEILAALPFVGRGEDGALKFWPDRLPDHGDLWWLTNGWVCRLSNYLRNKYMLDKNDRQAVSVAHAVLLQILGSMPRPYGEMETEFIRNLCFQLAQGKALEDVADHFKKLTGSFY